MIPYDFHLHTRFCDGADTPTDMAAAAFAAGFEAIGFSGHAPMSFESFSMSREGAERYRAEIADLKRLYEGKMAILCGIEKDFFGEEPEEPYDHVIGSVHYLPSPEGYRPVDESPEITEKTIAEVFGGDADAYAEAYFGLEARLFERVKADVIGHFDLLTKFDEKKPIFDPSSPRYRRAWREAADALIPYGKPFEINTGAISRGWREAPYPSREILLFLKENGGRILLSSDSHAKGTIGFRFDLARELALSCGFRTELIPKENGWEETPL